MAQRMAIRTGDFELSALVAGSRRRPALVLVHGWPLSSAIWKPVMAGLSERYFVLAFDLPGIGRSRVPEAPVRKTEIAELLLQAAEAAGAKNIAIAGVDVGGMIAFSAARDHGQRIERSVIISTAIPGVEPWTQVLANPKVWHFAFHQVPALPELLVGGNERAYFDFFLDALAVNKSRIDQDMRNEFAEAYSDPAALKVGFDWYRAMPEDARHNKRRKLIETPILYLRGDASPEPVQSYVSGLREVGATQVKARTIRNCGEIVSLEQPEELVEILTTLAD
jgi:pimeloyl-ACP methyl ester carboxylesterase